MLLYFCIQLRKAHLVILLAIFRRYYIKRTAVVSTRLPSWQIDMLAYFTG